jgi:ATP-dependent DNA helicase RecG
MTTPDEFRSLLAAPAGARIEFKTAATRYDFTELLQYIVAIANEGGGKILLGVTDKRPRTVVGTEAFPEPGQSEAVIEQKLAHRVPIEEYRHEDKRVLIVHVPARLPGSAWDYDGKYLRRSGDALAAMTDRDLRSIFAEVAPDFSAEICSGAAINDLNPEAIATFRERWAQRSDNPRIRALNDEQVLLDCGLVTSSGVTFAALILLGKAEALNRHLPHAEIIFEYRSQEAAGPAQDRVEFRQGFLLYQDKLWDHINLRNDRQSYQDGFFRTEISTFDELVVREAVLNALCHRDYRLGGSIIVRQYARRLEIVSPGGFPAGITIQNILDQQAPRNYRLADACLRYGLVERAGQGVNLMFERSIRQSKALPDYRRSSEHLVFLTLEGTLINPAFLRFLERVGLEKLQGFSTEDFLVLNLLKDDMLAPPALAARLPKLLELGVVERVGKGRGARYLLSRSLYASMGQTGVYTRRRGLDHNTNMELLYRHIVDSATSGVPLRELKQVLPSASLREIQSMLQELKSAGRIRVEGISRGAHWFPS